MREHMMFFVELRHHLKGANWKPAKVDGVVERIQRRRGQRGFGTSLTVASDGVTTTVRYGGFIGVARCNPSDVPVYAVGVAVASKSLAHGMARSV